jgi:hypothetical protein
MRDRQDEYLDEQKAGFLFGKILPPEAPCGRAGR